MKKSSAGVVAIAAMSMAASLCAQTAPPAAPTSPPQTNKPGLVLSTPAFEDGATIPDKFTASAPAGQWKFVSPPLAWSNVPDGTVSFVLIMRDPDVAINHRTDEVLHWMMFNIPATAKGLAEAIPAQAQLPDGSIQARNQRKDVGYLGPGARFVYHHYTWNLFALDSKLDLGPDAALADVLNAMQGHILGKGVLVGRYHQP